MSSLFRSVFFVCTVYCSWVQAMSCSLQAMSCSPIALAPFFASEQFACARDQLQKLNPVNVSISTILLEISRQREARNLARESSLRKAYAGIGKVFSGIKWFSGVLFAGAVFLKDNLGALAGLFGKPDLSVSAMAVIAAGGFMYLRHEVNKIQATQEEHTQRLGSLQQSSSTIISTLSTQGNQLTNMETAVAALNEGQERLEGIMEAARALLGKLSIEVGENSETLQVVSESVQDLVARLVNLEQGVGTLNSGFAGLQTSFNESNEALNLRFTGFENTVSGLSSRVDDGFGKVDELRLLIAECIEKTSNIFGENSDQVRALQDELKRLAGGLDTSLNALREEVRKSNAGTQEKLDLLIAASSSQVPAIQFHPEAVQTDALSSLLLRRKQQRNFLGLPVGDSSTPSLAGFARMGLSVGEQSPEFPSTAPGSPLLLTHRRDQ